MQAVGTAPLLPLLVAVALIGAAFGFFSAVALRGLGAGGGAPIFAFGLLLWCGGGSHLRRPAPTVCRSRLLRTIARLAEARRVDVRPQAR